jgi:hypothetical protein
VHITVGSKKLAGTLVLNFYLTITMLTISCNPAIALLFLLLVPPCVFCQSDKIETDQPDQSNGASVVKQRVLQVESSFYLNHFKEEGDAFVNSSLLRYGFAKKLEARLLSEQGYHRDLYISETAHATSPLAIGTKVELLEEKKVAPAVSVLAWLQLPITNFKQQPDIWAPAFTMILEKHVAAVTITLNEGVKQEAFEPVWEWQSTADLKYALSEQVTVFGEYFGQFEDHETPLHNVDAGILYAVSKSVQVHLAGGSSIRHQPSNYFINTGVAFNLHL